MKKLDDKGLEKILGGYICRGKNGSYNVVGKDDNGNNVTFIFGDKFHLALECDWEWFKKQYNEKGIFSLQELEEYYNYGCF
ncbi:MAG: hypothetical protein RUMPE_00050 [Eubacteriales bacterium SKADARSKE-1]|nr:hypothetical protein [Eubacteriales bacterium SKADARSKE-1]